MARRWSPRLCRGSTHLGSRIATLSVLVIDRSAWATDVVSVGGGVVGRGRVDPDAWHGHRRRVGQHTGEGCGDRRVDDERRRRAGLQINRRGDVARSRRGIACGGARCRACPRNAESCGGSESFTGAFSIVDGPLLVTTMEYDRRAGNVGDVAVGLGDRQVGLWIDGGRCRSRVVRRVRIGGSRWGRDRGRVDDRSVAEAATVPVTVNVTLPPTARSTVVETSPMVGPASSQWPPADATHVHEAPRDPRAGCR